MVALSGPHRDKAGNSVAKTARPCCSGELAAGTSSASSNSSLSMAGRSLDTTYSKPLLGSAAAPPKFAPPLLPGISIVFCKPGGVNKSLVARALDLFTQVRPFLRRHKRAQVFGREALSREGRRALRETAVSARSPRQAYRNAAQPAPQSATGALPCLG